VGATFGNGAGLRRGEKIYDGFVNGVSAEWWMPVRAGMTGLGRMGVNLARPEQLVVRFWVASLALRALAMTLMGHRPKLTKVFCGAFFQKSDRLLS